MCIFNRKLKHDFIYKQVVYKITHSAHIFRSDSQSQYWMGAVRDAHDRNNWKWLNGNDLTVSFWSVPSSGPDATVLNGGDCARFDGSKGWLWSDTNCNAPLNFICQHRSYNHSFLITKFIINLS